MEMHDVTWNTISKYIDGHLPRKHKNELSTNYRKLKSPTADGKNYKIDCANRQTII